MPRKQYYLSGNSFTTTDNELTVTFDNPRELQQVTVTHAGFTLDLSGPNPPPAAVPSEHGPGRRDAQPGAHRDGRRGRGDERRVGARVAG